MISRILNPYAPINWNSSLNSGLIGRWKFVPGIKSGFGSNFIDLCNNRVATLSSPQWLLPFGPGIYSSFYGTATTNRTLSGPTTFIGRITRYANVDIEHTSVILGYTKVGLDIGFEVNIANIFETPNHKTRLSVRGFNSQTVSLYENLTKYTGTGTIVTLISDFENTIGQDILITVVCSNLEFNSNQGLIFGSGGYGKMDDIRIFNRVLTDEQITAIYYDSLRGADSTLNYLSLTKYFLPLTTPNQSNPYFNIPMFNTFICGEE